VKDIERAKRWKGLRQDSGDPFIYAPRAKEIYESMGIDYRQKSIVYSDALKTDKVLKLKAQCDELGFPCKSTCSVHDYT
jgi:nicotinate phosphoribosyltransferase